MSGHEPQRVHLDAVSLAQYIEGGSPADERGPCDAHLAECPECRAELIETRRILATIRPRARWRGLATAASAAAILLLVWTGSARHHRPESVTRDAAVTTTVAPLPVTPLGSVA